MSDLWWSWGLSALGFTTHWLMSTGRAWPWLASACGQCAWIVFGATTGKWGFVASGIAYAIMQVIGWRKVRRRELAAVAQADEVSARGFR